MVNIILSIGDFSFQYGFLNFTVNGIFALCSIFMQKNMLGQVFFILFTPTFIIELSIVNGKRRIAVFCRIRRLRFLWQGIRSGA